VPEKGETNLANETTPLQLVATPASTSELDLHEIQGDILIGLQKKWERFVFFSITDAPAFKNVLRSSIAPRITSSQLVLQREFLLQTRKLRGETGQLPLPGVNLGFTQSGLQTLLPGVDLTDPSFAAGGTANANDVGDPVDQNRRPTTWDPQFLGATIHGVFLITGGTEDEVDTEWSALSSMLGGPPRLLTTAREMCGLDQRQGTSTSAGKTASRSRG
jgi:hypothetical protein